MSKVMVVDDEQRWRDELELAIARAGHEVKLAANSREAIDIGVRFRPNVLVTDWMLRDRYNGLHVAEALQTVYPEVQTILITGYASGDLRDEAAHSQVFEFLEKPFRLEQIQSLIQRAAEAHRPSPSDKVVGIIETDRDGIILYANHPAREMITQAMGTMHIPRMADLCPSKTTEELVSAATRWITLRPPAATLTEWLIRAREWPDSGERLYVIMPAEAKHRRHNTIVKMLLELTTEGPVRWPLPGHALILDSATLVRRTVAGSLENIGCICHAASNAEMALRLFERDPEISVVLVDYDLHHTDVPELVRQLRSRRPEVVMVGICATDRRAEFSDMGIGLFLEKPYVISDLINLITHRIGNCVDCGLPIPLRRPQEGETGHRWICCGCGARYYAIMDDDFPGDVLRHVRRADTSEVPG